MVNLNKNMNPITIFEVILFTSLTVFILIGYNPSITALDIRDFVYEDLYASLVSLNYLENLDINHICNVTSNILTEGSYIVLLNNTALCGTNISETRRSIEYLLYINGSVYNINILVK